MMEGFSAVEYADIGFMYGFIAMAMLVMHSREYNTNDYIQIDVSLLIEYLVVLFKDFEILEQHLLVIRIVTVRAGKDIVCKEYNCLIQF